MDYQLSFCFLDSTFRSCQVRVKDTGKAWVGVLACLPDRVPVWFAYNRLTGQTRRDRCLRLLRHESALVYGRIVDKLERL